MMCGIKDHWRRILVFVGAAVFVYFALPSVIYVLVWRTRRQLMLCGGSTRGLGLGP